MGPELLDRIDFGGVRVIHLSGITPALSDSCRELVRAVLAKPRGGTRVSFDLNFRPALWTGRDASVLTEFAGAADILLSGDDEAVAVWGTDDPIELRKLLPGPETLVLKQGARGVTLIEGDRAPVFVPALRVDVVEPVGAGDAFAAGFLAATLRDADPRTRLRSGHLQAAATLRTHDDVGEPLPPAVVAKLLEAGEEVWATVRLTDEGVVFA
jgi:2-dehydro-3-deoxygluconokinase